MKTANRYALVFLAMIFVTPLGFSQKVGTASMQFLQIMPCARGTALGDAYSVWVSGAEAVFWNPSGLARTQNQEFSSTYIQWIFDARQMAASYAISLQDLGSFGLQLQYVDYGSFEETSVDQRMFVGTEPNVEYNPGLTGRTFAPYSYVVGLSYGRSFTDKFSVGLTAKYAHESLFNDGTVTTIDGEPVKTYTNGLLFDFGLHYSSGFRSIEIAAVVQNFGAQLMYAKEASPAPLLFRVGIAADLIGRDGLVGSAEDYRLGLAFDLFQPNDYTQQQHVGIEYDYDNIVALRAGYKFNYDTEGFTAGLGIRQTITGVRFSLDYSYGSLGTYLGNVHRISLGAGI
jgi:hypothetical protein